MDIKDLIKRHRLKGLLSVEIVTLAYMLFTAVLIGIHHAGLNEPSVLVMNRVWVFLGILVINIVYLFWPCRLSVWLRLILIFLTLIVWYPETYDFCSQYPYLDHFFAGLDQRFFGCQPALEFNKVLSGMVWNELFCFGYYMYYYLMASVLLFYMVCRYKRLDWAGYVFMGSFFIYYVVFDFLPVAGPQYYFHAIGTSSLENGVFPQMGYFFKTHLDAMHLDVTGPFSQLVAETQEFGERPTAAFPSSHVGMSTVAMILAWKSSNRWLFWILMPVFILLCCATVYIRAHYLVDSIAGLISAFLFYWLTNWSYKYVGRRHFE